MVETKEILQSGGKLINTIQSTEGVLLYNTDYERVIKIIGSVI